MNLITTNQSQILDKISIERFGISTEMLMKKAGSVITKKSHVENLDKSQKRMVSQREDP